MRTKMSAPSFFKFNFLLQYLVCFGILILKVYSADDYNRQDFPPSSSFVFGASSSAYQAEGAAFEDGRTPSIWDTAAHAGGPIKAIPVRLSLGYPFMGKGNGDIACDSYHKYKDDVRLMVETGLEAYRFSISWSRLIPNGSSQVNAKGLEYYNNLINELIANGIQPHVTLVHGDIPQILEDKYGGIRSRKLVKDFVKYADVCFREFGNRVLHWTTFNEPNIFGIGSYDMGILPPCRCSAPFGYLENCTNGDSIHEPFIVGHNFLLAHTSAATLYRKTYQATQHGFIGINLYAPWFSPGSNSSEDAMATQRAIDYSFGWFMHPLVFGDYPEIMKKNSGSKLPTFTKEESIHVKGSFDFIGVNHYQTVHVMNMPNNLPPDSRDLMADMGAELIGLFEQSKGDGSSLQSILEYLMKVYGNPPIFVHENGYSMQNKSGVNDMPRVKYLQTFIKSVLHAIRNGSNTRGYFVWSFLDSYELFDGSGNYGLYFVDFDDEKLTRLPKLSAKWYSNFLKTVKKYQSY